MCRSVVQSCSSVQWVSPTTVRRAGACPNAAARAAASTRPAGRPAARRAGVADGAGQRVGGVGRGQGRPAPAGAAPFPAPVPWRPGLVPTTDFLICSAVYSCTARPLSAMAHNAAPRAWPSSSVEAGLVFRKTISSAATSGFVSRTISAQIVQDDLQPVGQPVLPAAPRPCRWRRSAGAILRRR